MNLSKIALAAALTLASGTAFAASGQIRTIERGTVQPVAMERTVGDRGRAVTGAPASAPTIFGHAPLDLRYDRPLGSNN